MPLDLKSAIGNSQSGGRCRVLLVISHPIQYNAPVYRLYAADPRLDVTVVFCSMQGAEPGRDPGFGRDVAWDVPLLDGYRWVRAANRSPWPGIGRFLGLVNPGLWPLVRRGRFDLVVCYGYNALSYWIAGVAAKLSRARLALAMDAHTLVPADRRSWKVAVKRFVLPRLLHRVDAILAPSSKTARFLERLGVPASRIFLIPYVIDNAFFREGAAAADRAANRGRWRVPHDATVAFFVGKLVARKRPADLIDAASRVEGLHVVFAGDGALRGRLQRRAREMGLAERVRFLGFVNQRALPGAYAAADVLVLPSEHEPFGLVVNEAFACGLPAIVSEACGAAGDLVREAETGYVVSVGDVAALAERLGRLAGDPELRRAMGQRALDRIEEWGPLQNRAAFADACRALAGSSRP